MDIKKILAGMLLLTPLAGNAWDHVIGKIVGSRYYEKNSEKIIAPEDQYGKEERIFSLKHPKPLINEFISIGNHNDYFGNKVKIFWGIYGVSHKNFREGMFDCCKPIKICYDGQRAVDVSIDLTVDGEYATEMVPLGPMRGGLSWECGPVQMPVIRQLWIAFDGPFDFYEMTIKNMFGSPEEEAITSYMLEIKAQAYGRQEWENEGNQSYIIDLCTLRQLAPEIRKRMYRDCDTKRFKDLLPSDLKQYGEQLGIWAILAALAADLKKGVESWDDQVNESGQEECRTLSEACYRLSNFLLRVGVDLETMDRAFQMEEAAWGNPLKIK